jgi:hypothetical protein
MQTFKVVCRTGTVIVCFMLHQYVKVLTPTVNLSLILLTIFGFSKYTNLYNVSFTVFGRFPLCGMQYNHNVIDQPQNLSAIEYT